MKKRYTPFLILLLILSPVLLQAQISKTLPTDYTQMAMQQVMDLDPSAMANLPVYDQEGKLLSPEESAKMMTNGDFVPEYYADANGKPAAIKLREITQQEKDFFKQFEEEQKRMAALIGTEAMDFETVDMEGNPVKLSDLKGSVVAINFWFIGCKPCIMEMPELNEIVHKFKNQGVKFVAIATDKKASLEKFAQRKQFDYDVIPDGKALTKLYQISGYPTHCIVDQEGKIAYFKSAYSPQTASELEGTIQELLGK
ncbi:MAG: TlpA family protein disulfide reductase [Roseivirga sp.]|nr:TlpA family protein disulfide reductase [Roseivirga sp.]